ncbi:hypothetical protein LTR84_012225 [Exophiala bonariae]|uniref:C2H2-type domain-containing protein n=1 Tax=Exophiala bonariae TaxID=1690606 RepID=A0AAV9NHY5_9EURO|nr:hypothetical protein LTR84_012225 [Exophiala bonariae]
MFGSTEERRRHEISHSRILKCSDPACDLADHAFTRQSLRRHIAKYHQDTTDPIFPDFISDAYGAMTPQKKQLLVQRDIAAIQKTPQPHIQQDISDPSQLDQRNYFSEDFLRSPGGKAPFTDERISDPAPNLRELQRKAFERQRNGRLAPAQRDIAANQMTPEHYLQQDTTTQDVQKREAAVQDLPAPLQQLLRHKPQSEWQNILQKSQRENHKAQMRRNLSQQPQGLQQQRPQQRPQLRPQPMAQIQNGAFVGGTNVSAVNLQQSLSAGPSQLDQSNYSYDNFMDGPRGEVPFQTRNHSGTIDPFGRTSLEQEQKRQQQRPNSPSYIQSIYNYRTEVMQQATARHLGNNSVQEQDVINQSIPQARESPVASVYKHRLNAKNMNTDRPGDMSPGPSVSEPQWSNSEYYLYGIDRQRPNMPDHYHPADVTPTKDGANSITSPAEPGTEYGHLHGADISGADTAMSIDDSRDRFAGDDGPELEINYERLTPVADHHVDSRETRRSCTPSPPTHCQQSAPFGEWRPGSLGALP